MIIVVGVLVAGNLLVASALHRTFSGSAVSSDSGAAVQKYQVFFSCGGLDRRRRLVLRSRDLDHLQRPASVPACPMCGRIGLLRPTQQEFVDLRRKAAEGAGLARTVVRERRDRLRFQPELRDQVHASVVHYRAGRLRICDRIAGTIGAMAGVTLFVVNGWRWWLAILIPVAIAEWSDILHAHTIQAWVIFKRNPKFRTEYALTFRPRGHPFQDGDHRLEP